MSRAARSPHNHDMPLVRPCARPGCSEFSREGKRFCAEHAAVEAAIQKQAEARRNARPNRARAREVYGDPRWRACRAACLARAGGHCEVCGAAGPDAEEPGDAVLDGHHLLGITGTEDDFDPELVLIVCRNGGCHARLEELRRRGYASG